jgi:hypothetical protein
VCPIARTPWLGRVGLGVVAIVFLLGAVATTLMGYRHDPFMASPAKFAGGAVVIAVLVVLAFKAPVMRRYAAYRLAPSAWILGLVSLAFASTAMIVPMSWGWGAVAALLALDLGMVLVVAAGARTGTMALTHQLAWERAPHWRTAGTHSCSRPLWEAWIRASG